MEKLYEAEVTTLAGRNGHAKSSDGLLDLDVRFPKEMGGAGGATNPEQLFAAAWSACFGTSVSVAAGIEKVTIGEVTVTAKIGVLHDSGTFNLGAHLLVKINDVGYDTAKKLVEVAQSICSYSKATKGNINTLYDVVV
ncbi:organic hydroperoxide resistance protein [Flavobacterium cyanobacteriorum]|uniref:Organic hydroperoxide resistance protein n=1 Tax=Flavobacterium cyanobacteriorum TaxID=2022802 RepID=A0A255Z5N9_9FLAO|nr:Ohr family peroxiredoxin [Flavobacterium cyanobacteriorum]OYQ36742.1 organic hydroperoxide resistance protein [Flavobacterium cyanobacteriorum]